MGLGSKAGSARGCTSTSLSTEASGLLGSQTPLVNNRRRTKMLDYLLIMLNDRLARVDERGAWAVEYGLLIAGIAALIVVVVFAFGGVLKNIFSHTCSSVSKSDTDAGS